MKGGGHGTLEYKLVQYLEGIFHKILFQVFMEVKKNHDSLDQMRRMEILWGYGLGKNLQRTLERF